MSTEVLAWILTTATILAGTWTAMILLRIGGRILDTREDRRVAREDRRAVEDA